MIAALLANLFAAIGMLAFGWSIWMALAIFWLENLISVPFIALRLGLAIPALSDQGLEDFLHQQPAGSTRDRRYHPDDETRLRASLATGGRRAMAAMAVRLFLPRTVVFVLIQGVLVYYLGISNGQGFRHGGVDLVNPFDSRTLVIVGLFMFVGEAVRLYGDRRRNKAAADALTMSDERGLGLRIVGVHLVLIFGAVLFVYLGKSSFILTFIGLKMLMDLNTWRKSKGRGTAVE